MNVLKLAGAAAAAAMLTLAATPTIAATVYDAVADFSFTQSTGVNGVWSYGYFNGSAFVPYNVITAFGSGGYSWTSSTWVSSGVPAVVGNESSGTLSYATVTHGNDVLNVHPGASSAAGGGGINYDSIVRFTAPVTSTYSYSGFFRLLDIRPTGVNVSVGSGPATLLTGPLGTQSGFSGQVALSAGDTFDFRVNRATNYYNDSTGLSASITAVPEPATWAMMIIGFGAAGSMIRRRRAVVA
ncbi:MAG: PEPxxWA-CTERM sorting domain-containing protein [Alphaproteobacteria bacterium]